MKMENEQLVIYVHEMSQSDCLIYESPVCEIVEFQSEGNILTASGTVDDMPVEEW